MILMIVRNMVKRWKVILVGIVIVLVCVVLVFSGFYVFF